ncbi:MAG: hypothetical protein HY924_04215 [Elusimicrobia bacterium]|nr:hypothetical protein [Elusimicrobiota bacterium]
MGRPFPAGLALVALAWAACQPVLAAEDHAAALQEFLAASSSLSETLTPEQSVRLSQASAALGQTLSSSQEQRLSEASSEALRLQAVLSSGPMERSSALERISRIRCLLSSTGECGASPSDASDEKVVPPPVQGKAMPDMKKVRAMERTLGWDQRSPEGFDGQGSAQDSVTAPGSQTGRKPVLPKAKAKPLPASQLPQGFSSRATPPPAPEEEPVGIVAEAMAHWDRVGESPETSEVGRMTAATMKAVLQMFNLDRYEKSTGKFFENAYDPKVSTVETAKSGMTALKDAALTTASLLPTGAWTKLSEVTKLDVVAAHASTGFRTLLTKFRAPPAAVVAEAEQIAALNAKISSGVPLTRAESRWLSEATKGKSDVVFHATKSEVLEKEILRFADDGTVAGGRVAATTEQFVYGSRRQITSLWRKFINGVLVPKDGLIVFQGEASKVFKAHEVRGVYSGLKRLAGQQTSLGGGDVIITKAVYDTATKTLTVTGARMVTEGEKLFLLQSKGFALTRFWGRRVLLDGGFTSASAFIGVSSANPRFLEYTLDAVLADPPKKR